MLRSAARRALENNTGSAVSRHRMHPLVYVPYVLGAGFFGLSVWFAVVLQRWWPLFAVAPLVIIAAIPELLRRRADRGPRPGGSHPVAP